MATKKGLILKNYRLDIRLYLERIEDFDDTDCVCDVIAITKNGKSVPFRLANVPLKAIKATLKCAATEIEVLTRNGSE